jgi:hypothetical protein
MRVEQVIERFTSAKSRQKVEASGTVGLFLLPVSRLFFRGRSFVLRHRSSSGE